MSDDMQTSRRSLKSFGVAGLLTEDAHVLYQVLLETRALGRVSDLLVARMQDWSAQELRLRALVLFSAHVAHHAKDSETSEPSSLEVGWDEQTAVVGAALQLASEVNGEEFRTRITEDKPEGFLEEVLVLLKRSSSQLVLKYQPSTRRFEFNAVFDRSESHVWGNGVIPVEWIELESGIEEAPPVAKYVQLADLDYAGLLGQARRSVADETEAESITRIAADEPESELSVALRGQKEVGVADQVRIRGVTDRIGDHQATWVAGGAETSSNQEFRVRAAEPQVQALQARIQELEDQLRAQTLHRIAETDEDPSEETLIAAEASEDSTHESFTVSSQPEPEVPEADESTESEESGDEEDGDDEEEEQETFLDATRGLFGKVWPFKKKASLEEEQSSSEDEESDSDSEGEADDADPTLEVIKVRRKKRPSSGDVSAEALKMEEALGGTKTSEEMGEVSTSTGSQKQSEAGKIVNTMLNELEKGGLEKTVKKVQREAEEMKSDFKSQRAKMWVDGLVGDIITEKARLKDMAKKTSLAVRQKELEFKTKERTYLDELKRREEALKQKENTVVRLKDQVSQMNLSLERARSQGANANGDTQLKKRFNHQKTLLDSVKDENSSLKRKLEEMQRSLSIAKSAQSNAGESTQLKEKIDQSNRQLEEARRQNSTLLEKLADLQKKGGITSKGNEDLKSKLDQAMQLAVVRKREVDKVKALLEERDAEIAALRGQGETKAS